MSLRRIFCVDRCARGAQEGVGIRPMTDGATTATKSKTKKTSRSDVFGLYGQVNKRARWMPRQSEAKKDVVTCEKLRGGGKRPVIRRYLNGETHPM